MSDTLKDIPVFVAAVEAGSFAQAAIRLHLSRSAVGKSIARLEARLGVRLFQRTTRSQSLTDNGALFYERCLRALEEIRAQNPCWKQENSRSAAACALPCRCCLVASVSLRY